MDKTSEKSQTIGKGETGESVLRIVLRGHWSQEQMALE